jgi:hypothetical protein
MLNRQPGNLSHQGNRAANRLRLGAAASLELTSGTRPCLLDDISATGARMRLERPPAIDTIAMLRFHDLQLYGTVVWSHGLDCGFRFDRPLDPEDMRGMLWIVQNREAYERICRDSHAQEWSRGIWE